MTGYGLPYYLEFNKVNLENLSDEIAARMVFSLAAEAITYPKPGLVTAVSTGSHNDMDIFTFLRSSSYLYSTFRDAAKIAASNDDSSLMEKLRLIGKNGEERMLYATGGVNTHRGAIFLGVLFSAASMLFLKNGEKEFSVKEVCGIAQNIAMPELLLERNKEEQFPLSQLTVGQRVNQLFGIKGIKGEVLDGFPSVLKYGLPALKQAYDKGANRREAQLHSLITLFTVVQDSTVFNRKEELNRLLLVQQLGKEIISLGSVFTSKGREKIKSMDETLIKYNISPGGSADILSICIYLEDWEQTMLQYKKGKHD